jgi:ATP-dependent helicase/nuclease subunit A
LLEEDFRAREVEELNTLYVATTRARQTLVISASEAHHPNPKSVWHRLQAMCTPTVAEGEVPAKPHQIRLPAEVKMLPVAELMLPPIVTAASSDDSNVASKMGSALHRLLQWQSTDAAALTAVALEFALTKEQTQTVQNSANYMLNGEAAWIWDERQIDWQANEYELFQDGKLLRLDRLVRHRETQTWWVIDFKSALEPEKSAQLRSQLFAYKEAVSAAFDISLSAVQTAFVSGDGRLINSEF